MKIIICGSMAFSEQMLQLKSDLEAMGHEATVPHNAEKYVTRELSAENRQESTANKIAGNLIQEYYWAIRDADAVIIADYDKNGIKDYVGGNSFLEAGYAHALEKKLYFINGIPEMPYSDELRALQPMVLMGDLSRIL
ncbi:MAG: hypothetical protein WCO55_05240 [Candidatus Falkowbacteria bacterium]